MNLMRFIGLLLDYNTPKWSKWPKRVSIKATSDMSVTWDDRNESAMIQRSKRFLYAYTYIYTYTYVFIYSLINRKHIRCQVSELKAFTLDHVLTTTTISTWPAWRNRTPLESEQPNPEREQSQKIDLLPSTWVHNSRLWHVLIEGQMFATRVRCHGYAIWMDIYLPGLDASRFLQIRTRNVLANW